MRTVFGKISVALIVTIAFAGSLFIGGVLTGIEYIALPLQQSAQVVESVEIQADAWLAYDVATGKTLLESNAQSVFPIASITKLPAAAAFSERDSLWATTTIVWGDVLENGRAGKLRVGEEYLFHTLLFPLLLESSNDAAHVYSREDTELIHYMNAMASDLHLTNTAFVDSSGLRPGNVSTAYELRDMMQYIYKKHRHLMDITSLRSYETSINGWRNNNPFINDPLYIGGKHGYTPEAGRTAVAFFDERTPSGSIQTIGYILLGSTDLATDMTILRSSVIRSLQ